MEKLFIHLFTKYMETYQDTAGSLRAIEDILNTEDDVLLADLRDAIQQAHRIRVCRDNNIDLSYDSLGSHIDNKNLSKDVLKQLIKPQIEIPQLKKFINKQIELRQ